MNRRGFLSFLGAAAVASVVAPELFDVGRRIFLPPRGGWLPRYEFNRLKPGNPFLSVDELLQVFRVQSEFIASINREYDQAFLAGDRHATINIRRPPSYALTIHDQTTERLDDRFRTTVPYTIERLARD